jgi:ATP-dependent exoDNAse (exonuclease V) beta subunit
MTSRSLAVEASAGTGKTSTLVGRILHLVLEGGPGGDPLPVSSICAITFTEKAAGEMKVRLRQELEREAVREDTRGGRANAALRDLESAMISTFHAFAVSLLKERPVEAGLDPRFSALDDLQSDLFFLELWEPWIGRALRERRHPLEEALLQGISLEQVRELASTLRHHANRIRRLRLARPPSDSELSARAGELRREGDSYRTLISDSTDKLVAPLEQAVAWLGNPYSSVGPPDSPKGGRHGGWTGGEETVARVREYIHRIRDLAAEKARLPQQRVFSAVADWLIGEFLPEWERAKRVAGYLDFDDQLEAARQLLSQSHSARREFQGRYATLLVDEFQDTDPVQLEIVLLLSSTDLGQTDCSKMRAAPGRIFIVGDPKQSIYRFRGADVETYLELAERTRMETLGLERLELTTNFRSVPSILRFVDSVFTGLMTRQGHYQTDYLAFRDTGARASGPMSPSVHILGSRTADGQIAGSGAQVFQLEAARITRLILKIRGSRDWLVEETVGGTVARRVPRHGDIAVLLPVLSKVEALEEEFRKAGIPYVLEGGKFYYARSEVASAVTVLRSIANPNDQVALYGALRSIFFGLSDEDLLRAKIAGIPLDYRVDPPVDSPLRLPCRILKELHCRRHERPASETLEALLHQTGAREVLASRGFQSLANLGKLARQLRTLQQETTFSAVLALLGTIDEEELSESESRLMEEQSDSVRILTIHKAKGLDFKIVILGCLGAERGQHNVPIVADPHGSGTFALKIGASKDGWSTPGWDALITEEKKREEAELLRLLYVAMTRARDHLIISVHTKGTTDKTTGLLKAGFVKTRLAPIGAFLNNIAKSDNPLARWLDASSLDAVPLPFRTGSLPPGTDLSAVLRREYSELEQLLSGTPLSRVYESPAQSGEDAVIDGQPQDTARTRAVRQGVAFHEAMECLEFGSPGDIPHLAAQAAQRNQLDGGGISSIEEMMNRCLQSSLIRRARLAAAAGGRLLRELPYVRPLQSEWGPAGMEEGRIDLLFEEDGGWVLVDYKTDQIPPGIEDPERHFRMKYQKQIEQYAAALAAAGIKVEVAYLLLARTGQEIAVLPS